MNNDTISRQDLLNKLDRIDKLQMLVDGNLINVVPRENVNKIIEDMPSAQKKGEWLFGNKMPEYPRIPYHPWMVYCSECKTGKKDDDLLYNFCPNCGADMRGR